MSFRILALSLICTSIALAGKPGGGGGGGLACGLKKCYVVGSGADVAPTPSPGFLLAGGGTDSDDGMRWLVNKANGGDFVVIRASGTDDYNAYIKSLGTLDSVETMVINSRTLAGNAYVIERIRTAEAIFIAGGAQNDYVNYWKDTALETAINQRVAQGVAIGGTSAGLAVLGQFIYSALNASATSVETLANPYNANVTLAKDFLSFPVMAGIITDTHFVPRDRMGRLLGFMARLAKDGWTSDVRAIAVDEKSALGVDIYGNAQLFGAGVGAYFLQRSGMPEVCSAGVPLSYSGISVYRIKGTATFNISTWLGTGGDSYYLSVNNGVISSSNGSIY